VKHLVVARYQEDDSWYSAIPDDWQLLEVQKDREVPNTGREASSYLWAILKLYPTLADDDLVAFVQGNPFPHCHDIDLRLLLARAGDFYQPLGAYEYVTSGDGGPDHPGIPVREKYEEWVGGDWPGSLTFTPGAQFVVSGRLLKKRPPEFYQRLLDEMHEDWNPWVMERLWPALFDEPRADIRATFYCQATPVTTYLRCELPARYLPGKVSRECVPVVSKDDYWFPHHQGAAVFQFAGDKGRALVVHGLQAKGVRVLMESDDNYFTVGPHMERTGWARHRGTSSPHSFEGHASILKWVDGCIVTTEHLAKQYRKHVKDVWVCPNTVDPIDWPKLRKPDDGVFRIGWFASDSHKGDGKLVRRAMEWAAAQPDVEVITMGYHPNDWRFPHKHFEWSELPMYRQLLGLLDVAVAPVVGTPWALCRSDLKALEAAMAGAVPVVSDQAPYAPWVDGENCLKAKDPAGFLSHIKHLVRNRDEAGQLAQAAREYVLKERTTKAQIHLWEAAIDG
jgi:glycosyltransferase involved in cell wall biosynthesis